jgi:hypothetical protein
MPEMPPRRGRGAERFESAAVLHAAVVEWARTKCTYPGSHQLWSASIPIYPQRDQAEARKQLAQLKAALRRFLDDEEHNVGMHFIDRALVDAVKRLEGDVEQQRERLARKVRREQGRLVMLVQHLSVPPGVDPVDYYAAAAVLVRAPQASRHRWKELVKPEDYESLFQQASRGHRKHPTLTDGIEVVKKRVREALAFWK